MLEQFSLTFMWPGGEVGAHAGHTPYQPLNSYQVNNGRIYCNHLRVMYYLSDVTPGAGDGGLFVLPGSHKAEFPWSSSSTSLRTMDAATKSLLVEVGGKAGTALIFSHDLVHCSLNERGGCRRVLHTAYNNAQFARGWLDHHTDYPALHDRLTPGTWEHYLTRAPDYMDRVVRPADEGFASPVGAAGENARL